MGISWEALNRNTESSFEKSKPAKLARADNFCPLSKELFKVATTPNTSKPKIPFWLEKALCSSNCGAS